MPQGDPHEHPTTGSPAIDAGDNVGAGEATVDLEGNARFVDDPETPDTGRGQPPLVDMGATERQADACPADVDGDGTVGFGDVVAILAA